VSPVCFAFPDHAAKKSPFEFRPRRVDLIAPPGFIRR